MWPCNATGTSCQAVMTQRWLSGTMTPWCQSRTTTTMTRPSMMPALVMTANTWLWAEMNTQSRSTTPSLVRLSQCQLPFGCSQLHGIWQNHNPCQWSFAVIAKLIEMLRIMLSRTYFCQCLKPDLPVLHHIILSNARPYRNFIIKTILIANTDKCGKQSNSITYWNQ